MSSIQNSQGGMGMSKHGKSGSSPNSKHFTGPQAGKPVRRKGETRKQRKARRGSHVNKYAAFSKAPKRPPSS